MKTLTEFSGFQLTKALAILEALTVAGKTEEEKSTQIAQEYKLEGDKLKLFLHALEVVKGHLQHLKRVVVLTLNEGEKAPENIVEKEGRYFLTEFFYVPPRKKLGHKDRKNRRRDKHGKKGGKHRLRAHNIGSEKTTASGIKTVTFMGEGKEKPQKRNPRHFKTRRTPRGPKAASPSNPLKITVTKEGVQMTAVAHQPKDTEAPSSPSTK